MNKITQKLLIVFAFSVLLLGGTNASFTAECNYSVSNKTKHTVKLRLGFANQYQKVTVTEIHRLGPGRTVTFDQGAAGNTVKVIDPGNGWERFRLSAIYVPGCFDWEVSKVKFRRNLYRYFTYLNVPKKGQLEIACNEDNQYLSQCK